MFTVRRLLGAAAAVAAVLAALPAPAQAAPTGLFTFSVHDLGVGPAGKVDPMRLVPLAGAPAKLTGVKLVLDTTDIAGFATAAAADLSGDKPKPSSGCTAEQAIVTCKLPNVEFTIGVGLPSLLVQLKDGAQVGQRGSLKVTLTTDQTAPMVATPTISVADDVDLAAGPHRPVTTLKPGAPVDLPIEITNTGTKPVQGAGLQLVINDKGLTGAPQYRNCFYPTDDHVLFCKFAEELAPGTTYRIAAPVLQVLATAPAGGTYFYAQFWSTGDDVAEQGDDWFSPTKVTPGDGPTLHLEAVPAAKALRAETTDSNTGNNFEFAYVKTPAAPSTSGSTGGTATATAGAPGATAGGDTGGGGGLPITGSNTMLAAGAGVLLLLVGAGLFVVTRRRRTSFTA